MGYIKHHAIVVTSWQDDIKKAKSKAKEIGLHVIGPSKESTNGYRSILICPDGSKEGWGESDLGDFRRAKFRNWLDSQKFEDGSSFLEWAEISYSGDDREAKITNHAWTKEEP